MNEGDAVVRHALEVGGVGGEFHDVSGGHEVREDYEYTPRQVGFTMPRTGGG